MTRDVPARRLLVAVEPRLFADALARVLRSDYEIVVADVSTTSCPDHAPLHVDVAVVSGALPAGVSASRVLRLPEASSGTGVATLRTGAVERPVAVGGLASIVAVLGDPLEPTAVCE